MINSPWGQPSYKKKKKAKKKRTQKKSVKKAKVTREKAKKTKKVTKKKVTKKKVTKKRQRSKSSKCSICKGPKPVGPSICRKCSNAQIAAWTALSPAQPKRKKKAPVRKKAKKVVRKKAKKSPHKRKTGGVRVECVSAQGKVRVRPVDGQGYDPWKNIQFPRHLRHYGCQYVVDALDDKGTHYRAVGEILPF